MKRSFVLLFTLCLIGLPILPTPLFSILHFSTQNETSLLTQELQTNTQGNSKDAIIPGPDLAIANWTSNRIGNPGFENWSTPTNADRWDPSPTGDEYTWFATGPPWPVSQGTYSGGLQCRSPSGQWASAHWGQYAIGADMQNLTLTFDWWLDQNQDPATNYFYVYVSLTNQSHWYTLYYWLNGTSQWGNSTGTGVYEIGGPSQQWNNFHRNITQDFLAIPDFPSSVSATLECRSIQFYVQSLAATSEHLRAFIDDVQMQSESITWIGGMTRDGNFESGIFNYWQTSIPARDTAYISQSASAYSGNWCANLTALSYGNLSRSNLASHPDCRITAQNPGILSFWWNLEYQHGATESQSYIMMSFHNGTQEQYVYYLIGHAGTLSWANTTSGLVLFASSYNTTGTWMYFERNIWDDAGAYFGTDELFITYLTIVTRASQVGTRIVTLFDEMRLEAGAVNGGGFEDQRAVGAPIRGLTEPYYEYSVLTVTDAAYAGNKATNLTVPGPGGIEFEQELNWRPIDGSHETYLDVMWRLEDFTSTSNDYAYIALYFDDGRYMRYYFAAQTIPSNHSLNAYFNVTGANTMNTWYQMHRDLVHDYEEAFGSLPDSEITYLWIRGASGGGNRLEILFDDLYLYDDPRPRLSNVYWDPITPNYDEAAIIEVDADDQDLDTVLLFYRTNGSPWQQVTMAPLSGITYRATVPEQPHDTFVEFLFAANDTWGMYTFITNLGNYWSYTVWDQSIPEVEITSPSDGAIINGTISISVIANDWGSGIANVEIEVNDESLFVDTSSPYTYAWDSTTVLNGVYTIRAIATDNVDLSHSVTISVTVNNVVPPPPIPGFPFEAIGLALITVISVGLLRRRKRN